MKKGIPRKSWNAKETSKKEVPRKTRISWNMSIKEVTRKIRCGKVENFLQQLKQGPFHISIKCNGTLYQQSAKLFNQEKYHILTY